MPIAQLDLGVIPKDCTVPATLQRFIQETEWKNFCDKVETVMKAFQKNVRIIFIVFAISAILIIATFVSGSPEDGPPLQVFIGVPVIMISAMVFVSGFHSDITTNNELVTGYLQRGIPKTL